MDTLEGLLEEFSVSEQIRAQDEGSMLRQIGEPNLLEVTSDETVKLLRYAFLYEDQGIRAYRRWTASRSAESQYDYRRFFEEAFSCWRSVAAHCFGRDGSAAMPAGQRQVFEREMGVSMLSLESGVAFRLAVTGVMSENAADARLELNAFPLGGTPGTDGDWRSQVSSYLADSIALLVRKADGWSDISKAIDNIETLRGLQRPSEATYLGTLRDTLAKKVAALELVALYHLAQMVTLTGDYLRTGADQAIAQLHIRLDRHHDRADSALSSSETSDLRHFSHLLWVSCRELAQNSIWTHIQGLPTMVRQFASSLASEASHRPVIELWPSQQHALRNNLLDTYPRAILVEMPTSAGKTLLAEFSIAQSKALNPEGVVVYIVPTRALVNQITRTLRADFGALGLTVEQAVPAFELDPVENRLLTDNIDVLVTTPEKLDLLIRQGHPVVSELSLVVADEAHNIAEQGRGPRLELLLGTLKRERAGARFLLLSPFMPNDEQLVSWLGEERSLPPIRVDWRPSRRVVGSVDFVGRVPNKMLQFETLGAAGNVDVKPGRVASLAADVRGDRSLSNLTHASVKAFVHQGSVLILCRGIGTSVQRATELARTMPEVQLTEELEATCRFVETELGPGAGLANCLRHGVAYHHSGLSLETRWLVELLIARGTVKVVCGTTTLAQGINFPITTVIVETLSKGDVPLSYQDFWNIAGRAGRTLVDTLGVVAFPLNSADKRIAVENFLKQEAVEITSQLMTLLIDVEEVGTKFDLNTLRAIPELSSLLQFLAHAVRTAGSLSTADEVEDILRSSLVFHQIETDEALNRLLTISRSYIEQVRGQAGLLTLADQTGFATPSVLSMLYGTSQVPELKNPLVWQPENLFGDDLGPLKSSFDILAELPEMGLGVEERGQFDSARVASIIRDWVRGAPLSELATNYPMPNASPEPDKALAEFSRYLFSNLLGKASWGMGALEGVSLAGQDDSEVAGSSVASMIYFGVQRREALWLRMAGAPRIVSEGLAELWAEQQREEPQSFEEVRQWMSGISTNDLRNVIPPHSPMTGEDLRVLITQLVG